LALGVAFGTLFGQGHNYTQGDIEEGGRLYRSNCIGCHGPEGNLVTGIDLGRNRFRRVTSDDQIVDVIRNGVPGTGMPPIALNNLRAYNVVAYLRSMNESSGAKSIAAANGDVARGEALFTGKAGCTNCHRVLGEGSRTGPDLSEVGLSLRAIEIESSILDPDAAVSSSNRTFQAVKKDGSKIQGLLLNEDAFSVQLLDSRGSLVSLNRADLRDASFVAKSPMPSYKGKLTPQELGDLIAYLGTLKGAESK